VKDMSEKFRVAIIDDEADMRESVAQWLQLSGFEPVAFDAADTDGELDVAIFEGLDSPVQRLSKLPVGGEGGYLLIEFSTRDTLRMMKELAFQLQMKGIKPVLAHPERYEALQARPEMAREWIRAGWWMQLDLPSIIGETGVYIQRLAVQMLKEGWFHIAATDLHKSPEQADYLQQMLKKLVKLVGYEDAERLLVTNPQRLLAGKSLLEADWLED